MLLFIGFLHATNLIAWDSSFLSSCFCLKNFPRSRYRNIIYRFTSISPLERVRRSKPKMGSLAEHVFRFYPSLMGTSEREMKVPGNNFVRGRNRAHNKHFPHLNVPEVEQRVCPCHKDPCSFMVYTVPNMRFTNQLPVSKSVDILEWAPHFRPWVFLLFFSFPPSSFILRRRMRRRELEREKCERNLVHGEYTPQQELVFVIDMESMLSKAIFVRLSNGHKFCTICAMYIEKHINAAKNAEACRYYQVSKHIHRRASHQNREMRVYE